MPKEKESTKPLLVANRSVPFAILIDLEPRKAKCCSKQLLQKSMCLAHMASFLSLVPRNGGNMGKHGGTIVIAIGS